MVAFDRVKTEFRRTWVLWLILNFSGGMKTLVNQSEQPFARSLVVCDTPVIPGNYTGSRLCGDRLRVIEEGFQISAKGQAQENLAMLCSLSFVSISIGAYGRKFTILVGLAGTLLSVVLFVVASSFPGMGRTLFSFGQGLQGLYPVEYIFGIVVLDLSTQQGGDGEATFDIKMYEAILGCILWFGLGYLVQFAELTEYSGLWTAILALNVGMFALALAAYPETAPKKEKDKEDAKNEEGPVMKFWHEITSYSSLVSDFRCRRFLMKNFNQNIMAGFTPAVMPVQLMAYHGWSQPMVVTFFLGSLFAGIATSSLLEVVFINRFGYHRTYCCCIIYVTFLVNIATPLALPVSGVLAVSFMLGMMPVTGFMPLVEYVDSRFCEPDQMHRFKAVQWIMGYFQGVFILPMYAQFFNAEGNTYYERCKPNIISVVFAIAQILLVFALLYNIDGKEGFGITVQNMDKLKQKDRRLWGILSRGSAIVMDLA